VSPKERNSVNAIFTIIETSFSLLDFIKALGFTSRKPLASESASVVSRSFLVTGLGSSQKSGWSSDHHAHESATRLRTDPSFGGSGHLVGAGFKTCPTSFLDSSSR
jgi:hypothetical protein